MIPQFVKGIKNVLAAWIWTVNPLPVVCYDVPFPSRLCAKGSQALRRRQVLVPETNGAKARDEISVYLAPTHFLWKVVQAKMVSTVAVPLIIVKNPFITEEAELCKGGLLLHALIDVIISEKIS